MYNNSLTDMFYQWKQDDFVSIAGTDIKTITAKNSGTYRLNVTNTDNCSAESSNSSLVIVKQNPVSPVIIAENYQEGQCMEEKSIILKLEQPSANYTYQWKRDENIIPEATQSYIQGYLQPANYRIVVDNNGCKLESVIQKIELTAGPPKPTLIAEGSVVWYLACSNDSASQFKWYYNGTLIPGANNFLYVANQKMGTYTVSIAVGQGCFTSSDPVTIPLGSTGISKTDPFSDLKIYPNPTIDKITIEMNNQVFGDLNITVFTEEGRTVRNIRFEKTTQYFSSQIDLGGEKKGVFIISFFISNFNSQRKLILQ
jgi:hypothetical protein